MNREKFLLENAFNKTRKFIEDFISVFFDVISDDFNDDRRIMKIESNILGFLDCKEYKLFLITIAQ